MKHIALFFLLFIATKFTQAQFYTPFKLATTQKVKNIVAEERTITVPIIENSPDSPKHQSSKNPDETTKKESDEIEKPDSSSINTYRHFLLGGSVNNAMSIVNYFTDSIGKRFRITADAAIAKADSNKTADIKTLETVN